MAERMEKILVRGVNWLGDAVMSTPALQRLREARPRARISILTPEKLAGLWEGQPYIDEVITFAPLETFWQVVWKLHGKKFTESVALPNSVRAALELCLAGIPRRIGVARPGRGLFLTHVLPPRPGAVPMRKRTAGEIRLLLARPAPSEPPASLPAVAHHIHDYLYLTKELGASPEPLPPRIHITEEEAVRLCQRLRVEVAPPDRPWFGLNPGAEYGPAKRWPLKKFAATAIVLQKQTNCRWLIFGGKNDSDVAAKLATEIRFSGTSPDGALNLAGKTSLRELAGALKLCRLVLTNDSGPMHLAAAVGTPVIVPFGSTSPELTGPGPGPAIKILRVPPPCAPCFRRDCPIDLRCLQEVKTAQAVEAAREILDA